MNSSEEEHSSEESSSEEIGSSDIKHKILWTTSSGWYTWTQTLGYPRPQGNLPMMNSLIPSKRQSLLNAYLNVKANTL